MTNRWPHLAERSASGIFFTSATPGPPKAVVETHGFTVLSVMSISAADDLPGCLGRGAVVRWSASAP